MRKTLDSRFHGNDGKAQSTPDMHSRSWLRADIHQTSRFVKLAFFS